MSWSRRFRLRQTLKGSLWVIPLLGGVVGFVLAVLTAALEGTLDVPSFWQYSPSTASTTLAAIVGAVAALTGFVITVSVLAIQMATGMFSARYMRLWYRDRMFKVLLAVLVGTLVFSLRLLPSVGGSEVPNLGVTVAGVFVAAALLLFLIFFSRVAHRMRPVAVAALVADAGRRAFFDAAADAGRGALSPGTLTGAPELTIRNDRPGVIQAVHTEGLVGWAESHDCLLVFPHAVGDFVDADSALIEVVGGGGAAGDSEQLRGMVALGIERTIEQDPTFAIRILVDIAIKALSPAVNDPTTAVQVLDHLGPLLRAIATSTESRSVWLDRAGQPRLVVRTRSFEDCLSLGITEIREFGGTSVQVVRRLRALLDDLLAVTLEEHRPAIEAELARLDATVLVTFGSSVDLDRAQVADRQGLGGPASEPARRPPTPSDRKLERLAP